MPGEANADGLRRKLEALSKSLSTWNTDTFDSVRKEIKRTKVELENLSNALMRTSPTHVEIKLNEKLVELYHREKIMWRQRVMIEWLTAGDKSTRFFHLRASMR